MNYKFYDGAKVRKKNETTNFLGVIIALFKDKFDLGQKHAGNRRNFVGKGVRMKLEKVGFVACKGGLGCKGVFWIRECVLDCKGCGALQRCSVAVDFFLYHYSIRILYLYI